ncbi:MULTISPECIES: exopolysaccharide biosynthesis protein [unclassified Bosea (in: a-proteobacteria)]|uniref:exopolysaccharide biosynthesis protein n=1 Tax=unclassified Bosea (in: a-proteobacteria) TaxID=2653178 RepID=UPI00083DDEA8|nr:MULTISPECIES: exopolysaccharide biosynthesis protein [unclassified Bosea (in: a-proteobacteria)]AOG06977.1 exopolysaccharide synthesis, ExoD family protein [Bosea sp. RAC05]MBA4269298.1 exopolysaccharide biosynthesis protein exod [Methylobacterium sp.]MBA4335052.1 exopolysaccharide biosynthesis protein exod [Methylobacterium sp.]WRH59627.1 MAG: exopolysaccharide biosynthesis protein [Bosea sp. (in: a-proteobacteria)]
MSSPLRTSGILTALAALPGDRIAVGSIVAALKDRAYALLVVLLGLPNCLPMPPPIPLVCGLVLIFVAIQMLTGRVIPWLPPALLSRSIGKPVLTRAVDRAVPLLVRLERISRPRLTVLGSRYAIPVIGLLILVLALGLVVAAPFIGQIPLGLAVCLVGLGLVERDGLLILAGAAFGAVGLVLSAGFAYAIFSGIHGLFF